MVLLNPVITKDYVNITITIFYVFSRKLCINCIFSSNNAEIYIIFNAIFNIWIYLRPETKERQASCGAGAQMCDCKCD